MRTSKLAEFVERRRALAPQSPKCINFITKSGTMVAMRYSQLHWATFDPSHGMCVHFSAHTVTLRGRNLGPLYDMLLREELWVVHAVDGVRHEADEDDTVVTTIQITQKPGGEPAGYMMPEGD